MAAEPHGRLQGVDQLGRERQLLLEPGAGKVGAFGGLGDRLAGHAEALIGGFEVEASLLDFEVERETQLALFFPGEFEIGIGLGNLGAGQLADSG